MRVSDCFGQILCRGGQVPQIPCVEKRLGRTLRASDFDETAPLTMEGYMTNPVVRARIGGLTSKGLKTIQRLYRLCVPECLAFDKIAESILGCSYDSSHGSPECLRNRPTP